MSKDAAILSKRIRDRTGWSQEQLAERLFITRNYLSLIETGKKPASVRLLTSIEHLAAAVEKDSSLYVLAPEKDYRKSGKQGDSPHSESGGINSRMLDPRFQPRAEPTPKMCLEYFQEFLAHAEQEPGGVGFTWRLLQKNFPLDEFEPKAKSPS